MRHIALSALMLTLGVMTARASIIHAGRHAQSRVDDSAAFLNDFDAKTVAQRNSRPARSINSDAHSTNTIEHASNTNRFKRSSSIQQDEEMVERAVLDQSARYGVLLDAGSSSTKVKVYTYTPGVAPNFVPEVQLRFTEKVKPGLGQYLHAPDRLTDYMARCLDRAAADVPSQLQASTPIYVMATAGLRTLAVADAKDLLENVREAMENTTINPFSFKDEHVSILSGEEEAVYAWLAANYLHGFFTTPMTREDSVGLMEMGGGSMQVAFLPDGPLYQEEFQMYVGSRRFDLYAQSYLSFGSRYISGQIRRVLAQDSSYRNGQHLSSPCMLRGDNSTYDTGHEVLTVSGTGNAAQCEQVLAKILEPQDSDLCSPKPCAIGDTYQPAVGSLPFYAISAFLYAPKFLGAVEQGDILNITKLRHKAQDYCRLTVDEAVLKTGTKPKFASNDCMMGLYIPLLLTRSMGFQESTTSITVTQDIHGTSIDWALGAMIQQLSMAFIDDLGSSITCRHGDDDFPLERGVRATHSPGSSGSSPLTSALTHFTVLMVVLLSVYFTKLQI